ncbi:hypothetical protein JCM10212_001978 [Sporobolomyces blumeae]
MSTFAPPVRPAAPLRTYTETVQQDVHDATASLLDLDLDLARHRPHLAPFDPTNRDPRTLRARRDPTREHHDSDNRDRTDRDRTAGVRRARSIDSIRISCDPSLDPSTLDRDDGTPRPITATSGLVRRANSTDLLVVCRSDEGDDPDNGDNDDDDDFASEDESFRFRPPSITSTTTSQRSSRRGIRIEDLSTRENHVFVKQLRIPTYHAVGSEGSGFVVFDIEIETLPTSSSSTGTVLKVHKRYSAFVRLRSDLVQAVPRLRSIIPRLPPKSSLGSLRISLALAFWLTTVLLHPVLGSTTVVREWVLE